MTNGCGRSNIGLFFLKICTTAFLGFPQGVFLFRWKIDYETIRFGLFKVNTPLHTIQATNNNLFPLNEHRLFFLN